MSHRLEAECSTTIERFYNTVRRHSTIGYVSLVEFETAAACGWDLSTRPAAVHNLANRIPAGIAVNIDPPGFLNGISTEPSPRYGIVGAIRRKRQATGCVVSQSVWVRNLMMNYIVMIANDHHLCSGNWFYIDAFVFI